MSNFNEYQLKILTFMNPKTMENTSDILLNATLGVAGESGEVCDIVKKFAYHGHELDKAKLRKELGDILFYVALGAFSLGATLEDIAAENVIKLSQRYPNGFTVEDSLAKKDELG